jgi:hypothetical protein
MGCGCGGSGGGSSAGTSASAGSASGVLLSGTLDGQYSGLPGGTAGPSVAAADITGASITSEVSEAVSSGGFWIVLFFVLGGAWYLDRIKKEHE